MLRPVRRPLFDALLGESYVASLLIHVAMTLVVIMGARSLDVQRAREARRAEVSRMVQAAVGKSGAGRTAGVSGAFRLDLSAPAPAPEAQKVASGGFEPPAEVKGKRVSKRPRRRVKRRRRPAPPSAEKVQAKREPKPVQVPASAGVAELAQKGSSEDGDGGEPAASGSAETGAGGAEGEPGYTAGAGAGMDRDALLRSYVAAVNAAVQRRYRYPRPARRARLQGEVVLEFRVDKGGRIHDVRVLSSSGHRLLDRAAVESVEQVAAVPPPPAELDWHDRKVKVAFVYALRG